MSETLPLFPLATVLFPGMRLPLHIFEQRYRQLVRDLLDQPEPRRFGVIAIRKGRETGAEGVTALHEIGCVATVRQVRPLDDGGYDLVVVGTQRFRLLTADRSPPYFRGEIEPLPEEIGGTDGGTDGGAKAAALAAQRVQAAFRGYLNALADRGGGVIAVADLPDEPLLLSYIVGAAMIIDLPERQALLAAPDALTRLRAERSLLAREIGMLRATTSRPAPDLTRERYSPNLRAPIDGGTWQAPVRHGGGQPGQRQREPAARQRGIRSNYDVPDHTVAACEPHLAPPVSSVELALTGLSYKSASVLAKYHGKIQISGRNERVYYPPGPAGFAVPYLPDVMGCGVSLLGLPGAGTSKTA